MKSRQRVMVMAACRALLRAGCPTPSKSGKQRQNKIESQVKPRSITGPSLVCCFSGGYLQANHPVMKHGHTALKLRLGTISIRTTDVLWEARSVQESGSTFA